MDLLIVANPVSGGGRSGRIATALAEQMRSRRHRVELLLTRHAGHATERVSTGTVPERVIAVGGDGTIGEIVNGLPASTFARRDHPERFALAVLPTGTANVLARELELPDSVQRVARLVETGRIERLDIGRLRLDTPEACLERRFVCMAGVGFDGLVTRLVAERRTGTQGFAAYTAPVWHALREYRPPRLLVTVDGAAPIPAGWVLVSLVRNYGGLFTLADRARPGSGRFEVIALDAATRLDVVRLALAGLTGGTSSLPGATLRRGTSVRVECLEPCPDVQVDGDWIGRAPIELELLPAALPVVVPD